MTDTRVSDWFGSEFAHLHPLLQALHREGGTLQGTVELRFGSGVAGWLGRRLARKTGLPLEEGAVPLEVTISHSHDALVWSRRFGAGDPVVSTFEPIGKWPDGFFTERTGAVQLELAVDTANHGWKWRLLRARWKGWPVPLQLLPRTDAYKRIENGAYRFEVAFFAPGLGLMIRYGGLLAAKMQAAVAPAEMPVMQGGNRRGAPLR